MDAFVTVRVWHEDRYAAHCGAESAQWASAFMGFPCRIVKAVEPVAGPRVSDSGWVRAGFADAEPALVISTASLDDLNTRLTEALPMNRFRPNLVVSFVPAYSEDRWATVRIGDVPVRGSRRCPRCALTTVDQGTGIKGREPLRTLATYRRVGSGEVVFGMNVRFERAGVLRVGGRDRRRKLSPPNRVGSRRAREGGQAAPHPRNHFFGEALHLLELRAELEQQQVEPGLFEGTVNLLRPEGLSGGGRSKLLRQP